MNKIVRIALIFAVVVPFTCEVSRVSAQSSQSSWLYGASGYAQALQLQKELKVPLIIYFYADWCPYCRRLDDNYLPTAVAQDYLQHVVKVRINPEDGPAEREIADRYNVTGYPRFYLFRNVATRPVNIHPFRRNAADMTPAEWVSVCRSIAPVPDGAVRVRNAEASVSKKVVPSFNKVENVNTSAEFLPGPLPSLDQVLDKYVAATGGLAAQMRFTSRVIKGRIDAPGIGHGGRFEIYRKAPNKSLTVINIDALGVNKHGFDGQLAWDQTTSGVRTPSGPALASAASSADFYRDVKLKQSYARMKMLGKVKHGWREVYMVEATRAGARDVLYFDVESGLLIRRDESHPTSRGIERAEIYFGDWREVDGVKIPFQQTQIMPSLNFVMNFEEVKHNVQVDDAMFRKPAK